MGIYDRDHRQNDPWKKTPPEVKQYKLSEFKNINSQEIKMKKKVSNWLFIIPIALFLIVVIFKNI
jgi:hypothetical protein